MRKIHLILVFIQNVYLRHAIKAMNLREKFFGPASKM